MPLPVLPFFYWFVVALKESGINPLLIICVSKYSFQKNRETCCWFWNQWGTEAKTIAAFSKFSAIFQAFKSRFLKPFWPLTEDEFLLESQHTYTYIWTEKWSSESISYTQLTTSKHKRTVSLHSIESMPHLALTNTYGSVNRHVFWWITVC